MPMPVQEEHVASTASSLLSRMQNPPSTPPSPAPPAQPHPQAIRPGNNSLRIQCLRCPLGAGPLSQEVSDAVTQLSRSKQRRFSEKNKAAHCHREDELEDCQPQGGGVDEPPAREDKVGERSLAGVPRHKALVGVLVIPAPLAMSVHPWFGVLPASFKVPASAGGYINLQ